MQRARHLRAILLTTLLLPAAAAQARTGGLRLFFEAAARTPDAVQSVLSALKSAPKVPGDVAKLLAQVERVERGDYPISFRMYAPDGWTVADSAEPPYYLAVLDSAGDLPIEDWLDGQGMARPGGPGLVLRHRLRAGGGRRYLFGEGWELVRRELNRFKGDDLPEPTAAQQRLLSEVTDHKAYAFVDVGTVVPAAELLPLRAAGGPQGTMFAIGADRAKGAWNLDIHWGARPGQGMIAPFVPPETAPGRLHGLLPWKPAFAFEANLGKDFGHRLERLGAARRIPERAVRRLVETLLGVWGGSIGFFQPEPPDDYDPGTAPPPLQLSPEYVLLIRVDADQGDAIVDSFIAMLGGGAEKTEAGTFAIDGPNRALHVGHRRGIVAICNSESAETSARHLEHVLAAAEGRRRAVWRMDHELHGLMQMWLSPSITRRLAESMNEPGPAKAHAWLSGILPEDSKSRGLGFSLQPTENSLRLRIRF